jgi:hypothetical protein
LKLLLLLPPLLLLPAAREISNCSGSSWPLHAMAAAVPQRQRLTACSLLLRHWFTCHLAPAAPLAAHRRLLQTTSPWLSCCQQRALLNMTMASTVMQI